MNSKRSNAKSSVEYIVPMKPASVDRLPDDPSRWLYEIKFDGYRVIAVKSGGVVKLLSSTRKPLHFPAVERALMELRCDDAVLDGEVVALDDTGRSSFQLLQKSRDSGAVSPICLYLFDLLKLGGKDLRALSTEQRKAKLAAVLAKSEVDHQVRLSANLGGSPERILEAAQELGLEGIVAKRRSAPYIPGARGAGWQKLKLSTEQEFVIGGYTEPEGTRKFFGSILVGYYQGKHLLYAAKAGSGFSASALAQFYELFQSYRQPTCPFVNLPVKEAGRWGQGITPQKMKRCTWLDPILVCQIRFAEWTMDGGLRQPIFLGMREDKHPRTVLREKWPEGPAAVVRTPKRRRK